MMNSLLQYYVLRRHDDTFDFHFYNANEYANECEQLSSSLCTVVVMSYGAKLLIVNLNISLYQPWKVHGLHEFIFAENDKSNGPLTFCENRVSGKTLVFGQKGQKWAGKLG